MIEPDYINRKTKTKSEHARKVREMISDKKFPYRRGNIVWVRIPDAWKYSTHIQAGTRRGVIFSNDINNLFSDLIYIIPCSRKRKKMKLHVKYHDEYILAEQIIPVDKSWVLKERNIEQIDSSTLEQVESNFLKQFGLQDFIIP